MQVNTCMSSAGIYLREIERLAGTKRKRVERSALLRHGRAIHVFARNDVPNAWMPGTSPGMTRRNLDAQRKRWINTGSDPA